MADDAIDERASALIQERNRLEEQIRSITDALTEEGNVSFIDTRTQVSGANGRDRMELLQARLKDVNAELNALPFEESYPVAIGVDPIGNSETEIVGEYS